MPRTKLPDVRPSLTLRREVCGFKCYFIVSFFDDGDRSRPAEVFCTIAKQGSVIGGLIDGLCRTISVSLQYGVTWPEIERGLLGHIFDRKEDPDHSSLLDGLAKAVNYLIAKRVEITGETGLTHIATADIKVNIKDTIEPKLPPMVGGIRDRSQPQ